MTIVVAQGVMILASLVAMRMAEKEGYWLVLLISFIALPIRGLVAAYVHQRVGRLPGADPRRHRRGPAERRGARPRRAHLNGTGRVNVGQGAVMTVQGIGASLSPGDRRLDRAGHRLRRDLS